MIIPQILDRKTMDELFELRLILEMGIVEILFVRKTAEEIRKAIKYGICKINIATDARIIWTRVHREFFVESPEQFDPVIAGNTYIKELEKF